MSTTPKHKGLGRGLDALIKGGATRPGTAPAPKPAAAAPAAPAAKAEPGTKAKGTVHLVPVHKIQKGPWQPRRRFAEEALKELADSIREKGVLEPVWLRQAGEIFHLIAGERRFRAAQLAGLPGDLAPARVARVDSPRAGGVPCALCALVRLRRAPAHA